MEKSGTLAMSAGVLPEDASDRTVTWSVVPGTGSAQIDASTGILTGQSGNRHGNGNSK